MKKTAIGNKVADVLLAEQRSLGTCGDVTRGFSEDVRYRESSSLAGNSHVSLRDVEDMVQEICADCSADVSLRMRMIAAVVSVIDSDPFGDAIYGVIHSTVEEIAAKVASWSTEYPEKEDGISIVVGDHIEWISAKELLEDADFYVPLIKFNTEKLLDS